MRTCSHRCRLSSSSIFFFNDTATTEIYTLSLHDALPISGPVMNMYEVLFTITMKSVIAGEYTAPPAHGPIIAGNRSEEHTSELQSLAYLVCRLLLEKKKKCIFLIESLYLIVTH